MLCFAYSFYNFKCLFSFCFDFLNFIFFCRSQFSVFPQIQADFSRYSFTSKIRLLSCIWILNKSCLWYGKMNSMIHIFKSLVHAIQLTNGIKGLPELFLNSFKNQYSTSNAGNTYDHQNNVFFIYPSINIKTSTNTWILIWNLMSKKNLFC